TPGGNDRRPDTIRVEKIVQEVVISRNGIPLLQNAAANVTSIDITGSGDPDTIVVAMNGLDVPVHVDGQGGVNSLIVTGTASADQSTLSPNSLTVNTIPVNFTATARLTVYTLAGADQIVLGTGLPALTVDGGLDTDTLVGTNGASTWVITGLNQGAVN